MSFIWYLLPLAVVIGGLGLLVASDTLRAGPRPPKLDRSSR